MGRRRREPCAAWNELDVVGNGGAGPRAARKRTAACGCDCRPLEPAQVREARAAAAVPEPSQSRPRSTPAVNPNVVFQTSCGQSARQLDVGELWER